jgi:PKD repeat protein
MIVEQFATFLILEFWHIHMSSGGPNSVAILRQSARHAVALGLVLLSVTVVGAALGGVTAAESQSSPVEISNWTDLDDIRNNLDADYVLVNDLNETTAGYETVAGPNANGGNGFDPIGGFNASFDGQGNSVANLTIDRPNENNVGLFGSTSGAAVIEEVILTGATVDGSDFVGGLVGLNDQGTMSNSLASGAVDGSSNVGGLVGFNFEGTVSNSLASGAVNGTEVVGGVVGGNLEGTVSNSSASGAVNGTEVVGGLVGENFGGTVSNASASGAVTGSSNVGGLVGENEGTVSESFATGAVTGSTDVGGLIGLGGTVTGSYWDTQATGQSQSAGGIGLNTSQMQGASAAQNMGALDFTSTWRVVTNPPGYPELRGLPDGPAQEPALTAAFNVTPEDPIVGEQLTFDADPSTPESDIEGYNWTLGDGTTATGKQVTHTYTDSGQFTVELTVQDGTETDTASETVTVNEPSSFDVTITSVNSTVTAGETIAASYEVTNTGGVQATQDIEFSANGSVESTEAGVTLNGSETVSGQFSYDTVASDTPAVNVTVASADDTASANVTVLAPAVFTVDIVETTTPAEGETLNVTAGIENTGAVEGTQTVTLDVGALGTDSTSVTLDGGSSTTLTLGVGTDTGDAGGYTATVSSANATTSANVTVLTPAQFVVSNLTAPAETTVGASITVSATVTNIGETDGPQTVAFRFDGQTVANRTVSLTPDASTTVAFTPTVPDQTGTFEHGVFTADDNQTAEITIVDPEPPTVTLSNLRIAGQENTTTVLAGSYNVSVTVSHDGGPGGVVPVELTVGPTTITENITLNASETTTVTFENATGDLSPGSYDVTVSAGNASVTGEVTLSVIVGDNPNPATNTDDDGLLEDVDGDGEFTIFDVQTFFVEFQSDPVQTNSALFNFDEDEDGAVTIFDVQALFTELN